MVIPMNVFKEVSEKNNLFFSLLFISEELQDFVFL